ncbi:MAG: hypothetical protein WC503_02915 [Candidatus Shapirobacteria bacterium]
MIIPDLVPYIEKFKAIRPYLLKCKTSKETRQLLNKEFKNIKWNLLKNSGEIDRDGNIVEVIQAYFDVDRLRILIDCGEAFYKYICDEDEIDRVIKIGLSMVGHELIHREQYDRRLQDLVYYTKGKTKEYLSRPEEIAAYGWQIAQELRDYGLNRKEAIEMIRTDVEAASIITSALGMYSLVFEKIERPYKRLIKTVVAYLEKADEQVS